MMADVIASSPARRRRPQDETRKLDKLAGGRVWTGRQAQKNGLVDELGTLRDALLAAKKAAGMGEDEKAELLVLPEPRNFLDELMAGPEPKAASSNGSTRSFPAPPNTSAKSKPPQTLRRAGV